MTLNWKIGGVALGLVFFLAVLLVKPIGVSTQFVALDGIVAGVVNPELVTKTDDGYTSTNAYLAKSGGKYAKSVANPLNYSFIFVIVMMVGAFLSAKMRGGNGADENKLPAIHYANFGDTPIRRYVIAFVGGFVVLYGARPAGGRLGPHDVGHYADSAVGLHLRGWRLCCGCTRRHDDV